jgi:hypothetical protein
VRIGLQAIQERCDDGPAFLVGDALRDGDLTAAESRVDGVDIARKVSRSTWSSGR